MCIAFSQIQAVNKDRQDPGIARREVDEATDHALGVMRICAKQGRPNIYFAYEHSANVTIWEMAVVKKVRDMKGVFKIKFDMCRLRMAAVDPDDRELKPI